ncbi:hypothetical protein RUM43_012223 [Polyplax serrata]|uniref:Uncharacterized protein n=1 Tax=Polyplax serrata TaxID=468196 RepID=A0AAN8S7C2_POLSC
MNLEFFCLGPYGCSNRLDQFDMWFIPRRKRFTMYIQRLKELCSDSTLNPRQDVNRYQAMSSSWYSLEDEYFRKRSPLPQGSSGLNGRTGQNSAL